VVLHKEEKQKTIIFPIKNGKMEEDVKPKDEHGVDGRGVCGWDGWVCGLGEVGS
jgi:hypothetical protein